VRVRALLAVALMVVAAVLVLDMSGRAPRLAGTDHTQSVAFVATMNSGQELCQPDMVLPPDTGSIKLLIGTYGRPVPELIARFVAQNGATVASGRLAAGGGQGELSIPIGYRGADSQVGTLCLAEQGGEKLAIAGAPFPAGSASATVGGSRQPGRIALDYLRPGEESWWQLLPTLDTRFGLGKSTVFGSWTLPVAALLLVGVWAAVVRLLIRELV